MMSRLNVLLLVLLVVSGLYLVKVSYDARRLRDELFRAERKELDLKTELNELEVARRDAATVRRVDQLARQRLNMRPATAAVTTYVPYASASSASAAASGAAR